MLSIGNHLVIGNVDIMSYCGKRIGKPGDTIVLAYHVRILVYAQGESKFKILAGAPFILQVNTKAVNSSGLFRFPVKSFLHSINQSVREAVYAENDHAWNGIAAKEPIGDVIAAVVNTKFEGMVSVRPS